MSQMHNADYFSKLQIVSPLAFAMFNPHISSMFPGRNLTKRPVRWGELYEPLPRLLRKFPYELKLGQKGILLTEDEVQRHVIPHVPNVVMPDVRTIKFKTKELMETVLANIIAARDA